MKFDSQLLTKWIQIIWGSSLVKLGSVIAIAGVAALTSVIQYLIVGLFNISGQSINIPDTPVWLGILLLAIGVGTAIVGTLLQPTALEPRSHPHDIALLSSFHDLISVHDLEFLRDHNFGGSFLARRLDCVSELVSGWRGARFEFHDPDVQQAFAHVTSSAKTFDDLVSDNVYMHHNNPAMRTVFDDTYDGWNVPAHTTNAIKALNNAASALVQAIDEFERTATQRIRPTN